MEILKYIISTCIGGSLVFLGNYLLEDRRRKNDQFKYTIDKMVTVGEEYYKLSSYSLIYFTSLIDTMNKREKYLSDGAHHIMNVIDSENEKQLEKVKEHNLTITTASFFFNVTDSEKAVEYMLRLKEANIKMHHGGSTQDIDQYEDAYNEYIAIIETIIKQIKVDQLTIREKIKEILMLTQIK